MTTRPVFCEGQLTAYIYSIFIAIIIEKQLRHEVKSYVYEGAELAEPIRGKWIAEIFSVKPCTSVLPNLNRKHFQ